jgi:hypothetical protein
MVHEDTDPPYTFVPGAEQSSSKKLDQYFMYNRLWFKIFTLEIFKTIKCSYGKKLLIPAYINGFLKTAGNLMKISGKLTNPNNN